MKTRDDWYIARRIVNAHKTCPVEFRDDCSGVSMQGKSYYHTTLSGNKIVHSPSAYGYRTWYHPSTRHVAVSREWWTKMRLDVLQFDGVETIRALGTVHHYGRWTISAGWIGSKKVMLAAYRGRAAHTPRSKLATALTGDDYADAMVAARALWAARDKADKLARIEREKLSRVWVGVDDSLRSGNCSAGTDQQRLVMQARLRAAGPLGAVRADVLLLARGDSYARRAINTAAARYA